MIKTTSLSLLTLIPNTDERSVNGTDGTTSSSTKEPMELSATQPLRGDDLYETSAQDWSHLQHEPQDTSSTQSLLSIRATTSPIEQTLQKILNGQAAFFARPRSERDALAQLASEKGLFTELVHISRGPYMDVALFEHIQKDPQLENYLPLLHRMEPTYQLSKLSQRARKLSTIQQIIETSGYDDITHLKYLYKADLRQWMERATLLKFDPTSTTKAAEAQAWEHLSSSLRKDTQLALASWRADFLKAWHNPAEQHPEQQDSHSTERTTPKPPIPLEVPAHDFKRIPYKHDDAENIELIEILRGFHSTRQKPTPDKSEVLAALLNQMPTQNRAQFLARQIINPPPYNLRKSTRLETNIWKYLDVSQLKDGHLLLEKLLDTYPLAYEQMVVSQQNAAFIQQNFPESAQRFFELKNKLLEMGIDNYRLLPQKHNVEQTISNWQPEAIQSTTKPIALILHTTYDKNMGFDGEKYDEMYQGYHVLYQQVDEEKDILNITASLRTLLDDKKLELGLLAGHGNRQTLALNAPDPRFHNTSREQLKIDTSDEQDLIRMFQGLFHDDADFILAACSTAQGGPTAQNLANLFSKTLSQLSIHALTEPNNFTLSFDGDSNLFSHINSTKRGTAPVIIRNGEYKRVVSK